jgi:predicted ATPase
MDSNGMFPNSCASRARSCTSKALSEFWLQKTCLDQGAAMAREQGALSWELRIALSRCRLRATQGRGGDGRQELVSLYARFSEGFDTADLIAAKRLLDELGDIRRD